MPPADKSEFALVLNALPGIGRHSRRKRRLPSPQYRRKVMRAAESIATEASPAIRHAMQTLKQIKHGEVLCMHLLYIQAQLGIVVDRLIGPEKSRFDRKGARQ